MSTLAERLQRALDAMNPPGSQADLARACGKKGPSVSDWFRGETKSLKADSAILAADFLNVRPRWLIDGTGPMRHSHPADKPWAAPEESPQLQANETPPAGFGSAQLTLQDALARIETALQMTPPVIRGAVASNMAGWANAGGKGPWRDILLTLLK
jgi:transcriptional regulator with XRE-family HTH domain